MATLKQRVHRMNSDGAYDVIHYETEAGLVLYANNSQSTVSGALDALFSGKANSSHNHAGSVITSGTVAAARLGTMTGATSSANGASGAVPAPAKGAATRYLRSDGTWQVPPDNNTTYSDFTAATSSAAGTHGLVPAPASGKQDSFLRGNKTWATANDIINTLTTGDSDSKAADYLVSQYAGGGTTTTSYHRRPVSKVVNATIVKAALGTGTGTTKYLREDGTWQVPPDTNTTYTAASANPKMDGTVAVGTSAKYAREDHVHPVDTSRAAASHNHAASNITSGTLAVARGGTGGADVTAAANSLQVASLGNGTAIPNTADLNTYTTLGNYHCAQTADARKIKHVPGFNTSTLLNTSFSAFTMKVGYGTGTGYPCQTIIQYDTGVRYYRVQSNGTWGDWKEFAQNTNTTYSNFVKSGSSAKAGLVPSPGTTAGTTKYLREDATWVVPPNTTYSNFVKSGSGAKAGLVPAPSTTAGTTKYLREDGTWSVPPDTNTTYSNMTAASAVAAGTAGLVPAPAKGKQTSFLRGDGTWVVPTNTTYSAFVKSGSTAAAGLVPKPSTTAGTTKYLREDATWVVPPNTNTDTKVNVTLATTTKAYLLGTSTTPTSTAAAVTALSDTGVYLDTTAGKLTATSFAGSGAGLTSLNGSNISSGTVPVARLPYGIINTNVTEAGLGVRPSIYYVSKSLSNISTSSGDIKIGTFTTSMTNTSVFAYCILQVLPFSGGEITHSNILGTFILFIPKLCSVSTFTCPNIYGTDNFIYIIFNNTNKTLSIRYQSTSAKSFQLDGFIFTNNTWTAS